MSAGRSDKEQQLPLTVPSNMHKELDPLRSPNHSKTKYKSQQSLPSQTQAVGSTVGKRVVPFPLQVVTHMLKHILPSAEASREPGQGRQKG